ncbi:T9SS type A sorting domain-containing protein [candidate division KSB1 bacterium]|nr:T9SS type A sorting domain-containing protein [candidate division KSB1 bacterium]
MRRMNFPITILLWMLFGWSVFFSTLVGAQTTIQDYFPLHLGDYWMQRTDSSFGGLKPSTFEMRVNQSDMINGKEHLRIDQNLTSDDNSVAWNWYTWIYKDTAGVWLGAFSETPELNQITILTRTIQVDGNPSDWIGINPLVEDPQADAAPNYTGDDLKAIYVAMDTFHLFIRLDLWDVVNPQFQNGNSTDAGRYNLQIYNNGTWPNLELGLAYNPFTGNWSLGYNGSNSKAPTSLVGPQYVGVNGAIIEIRVPLTLIGTPSHYRRLKAEVILNGPNNSVTLDEVGINAATIFMPAKLWLPNRILTTMPTWDYDAPELGGHFYYKLESKQARVVAPVGTFQNCLKIHLKVINQSGDSTQNADYYYAPYVGEVRHVGWQSDMKNFNWKLKAYSIHPLPVQVQHDSAVTQGQSLKFTITPPPNYAPTTRQLFYRAAGRKNWRYRPLALVSNQYEVSIPPDSVTYRGLEYYIYLSDGKNVVTYPATNPIAAPATLQVAVKQLDYPRTLIPATYKMISVPYELDDRRIRSVLVDDLGDFNEINWRIFTWQGNRYLTHPQIITNFAPGVAFWLITWDGKKIDFEGGKSTPSAQPYTIALQPGWNQIGNPFAFTVLSDSLRKPANVGRPVFFDGKEYDYTIDRLEPWEGYFIHNGNSLPVNMLVPPQEALAPLVREKHGIEFFLNQTFTLQIVTRCAEKNLTDSQNYLGFTAANMAAEPDLDWLEAPPIGDYIQLSIIEDSKPYASKFKPLNPAGQQWQLQLRAATAVKQQLAVTLDRLGNLPKNFEIYLLDQDTKGRIPLVNHQFSLAVTPELPVRNLTLLIGTPDFAEQNRAGISLSPAHFGLEQNYPNPFNPATQITYSLAQRTHVRLEIYNLLGQKIKTLVTEIQHPGQYTVTWDGFDAFRRFAGSGVYFYRLEAGTFTATRKLILLR